MNTFLGAHIVNEEIQKWVDDFLIMCKNGYGTDRPADRFAVRTLDSYSVFKNLNLNKKDDVLEIGAGFSYNFIYFSGLVNSLIVSDDFSWYNRDFAKQQGYYPEDILSVVKNIPNAKGVQVDSQNIQFDNNTFDKVYSISVLEHVPNDLQSLKEAYRVLKPGGIYALTTEVNLFVSRSYIEESFVRIYSLKEIIETAYKWHKSHPEGYK